MIVETLVVGHFETNCYIVASELSGRGLLIDPGAQAKDILGAVEQMNVSLSLIVLTHAHVDHFAALKEIKQSSKAEFATFDTSKVKASSRGLGLMMRELWFSPFKLPIQPDRLLNEGDTIDIDDLHFSVLYTPGHSPDSISFWGHGVVFCGDTLFNHAVGKVSFPGCNYEQLKDSICEKLMMLPDDTLVYPGHGPPTTIGEERQNNPFLISWARQEVLKTRASRKERL